MTVASDISPEPAGPDTRTIGVAKTRPLYWSVRRELWENRSVFLAPLAVAAVILFGGVVGAFVHHSASEVHATGTTTTVQNGVVVTRSVTSSTTTVLAAGAAADTAAPVVKPMTPAQRATMAALPYDIAALALAVTMFLVAVFYCLGALHNERRDRSILFWKSLPVSDLTTVLSKATLPLAILPAVTLGVTLATQVLVLLLNTAAHAARGLGVAEPWTQFPLGGMALLVLYGLVVVTLWWAPIYGWLMLVSAWARRGPFLWAVLPPLLLALVEKIALNTNHVGSEISYRLGGGFQQAFVIPTKEQFKAGTAFPHGLPELDPGKFLSTPGLWIGLVLAGLFLGGAVWMRRYREPI